MTTVGQILKKCRLEKKLTIADVEKATKIRRKFLEAIESGSFADLPPPAYARGFVKNYAAYLGLSVEEVLAFYRREVSLDSRQVLPGRPVSQPARFALTPQVFLAGGIVGLLLVFSLYLVSQYLSFVGSPSLALSTPSDYSVVHSSPVVVAGRTDPAASLTVNNQAVPASDSGEFRIDVPLVAGINTLTVVAENRFHRRAVLVRHIRLEAP